nr:DUF4259 domain-containing protein [uncultured Eisenbergiella sp.]
MGCWGITAFESDAGLDSVDYIRRSLPQDGRLELEKIVEAIQKDEVRMPDVCNAESHSSPMALAEIMVHFMDGTADSMDYDDAWAAGDKKFGAVSSFTASRESVRWLRNYLRDTLKYAMKNAEEGHKWGGWFQEKDWTGWQNHMETLIGRLDGVLAADGNELALFWEGAQEVSMEKKPEQDDSGMTMK